MYQFFKYNGKWRYRTQGWDISKDMDTFALEKILGVIGGPEVIVVRDQPNGNTYHITIKNGFIDKVENVTLRTEVDKFFAKEISL